MKILSSLFILFFFNYFNVPLIVENLAGDYQQGMLAWITLKGKGRKVIAVPTNALIQEKQGNVIWIRNSEGDSKVG